MSPIESAVTSIKFVERMLLGLIFVALMVHYFFHYQGTFFIQIFAIGLAVLYFPFGFYAIGKPSEKYSNTISVILGLVYALGVLSLLISAANLGSYRYPLIADFFVLLAVVIYLMFKMRAAEYPKNYINAQFIRIGFIVLCGLIILLK